jgi:hypothetical protein
MGYLIGRNTRNEYAERLSSKTLEQVDAEVRNELIIAKNLNKSLMDDVTYLRNKLKNHD